MKENAIYLLLLSYRGARSLFFPYNRNVHQNNRTKMKKKTLKARLAGLKFQTYGGPQLSHQNQMLTSNSNRSHQIQIAHIKFKSLTSNSNRPQQIQIVHSKLKSLTANSNCHSKLQIINSARRLRLSTASGTTRLKIFVIHEAATL